MTQWHWIVLIIISLSHVVGGVTAFGSSLLAVAALVALGGTEHLGMSVAVLAVCGLLQAGMIVWRSHRAIDHRALGLILVCALAGLPVGHVLSASLDGAGVRLVLGALLITGGLLPLVASSSWSAPIWLRVPLLVLAGIVHGSFASGGTVLIPYMRLTIPRKDIFRATLAMVWVTLNLGLLGLAMYRGTLPVKEPLFLGLACLGVVLATRLGQSVADCVDEIWFARIVSGAMVVTGVLYIAVQYNNYSTT